MGTRSEAIRVADAMIHAEADGYIDPFVETCGEIVDRIERAPATTLEGLRVKARAVAWCRSEEDGLELGDTLDMCIASQILDTLIAMEAGA